MSSDIVKQAVYDDRIVQHQPRYAVDKGALAVTNSPFNAIAANASQHTYNVLVPSENVFIDRSLDWTSSVFMQLTFVATTEMVVAAPPATTPPVIPLAGAPFPQFGSGALGLCAFPLQSMTTTMTATINDTTVTINSADVLPQVLRMTDYKKNRLIRTCPTQLDKYAFYDDAAGAINNPLSGYSEAMNVDEVPNGAFPGVTWTLPDGTPLFNPSAANSGNTQTYTSAAGGVVSYNNVSGIPCMAAATYPAGTAWTLYFSFSSTEKLVLSPFVFSDIHEWDTGLFGCQNIQLVMNLQQPSRVVRSTRNIAYSQPTDPAGATGVLTVAPGSVAFNQGTKYGTPFQNSRVNLQFLTPSLDVPLPPKSVVPYMEFPRYISAQLGTLDAGRTDSFQSQTITLPAIPDLLIIYARPTSSNNAAPYQNSLTSGGVTYAGGDPCQGDWLLPISGISVNFDNFAGLLSSHTQQQLYKMSVHNGLEMDWAGWSGVGQATAPSNPSNNSLPLGQVSTAGGMLVLKPGRDIALQAGQAPGLVGNFVLQFNVKLSNYSNQQVLPQLVIIAANSGFFETIKGSSRVIKGVLTEQDIISAPMAPGGTTGALRRAVGGSVLGSLGNALSRVKGMYDSAKPYVSAVKGCLESAAHHTGNKTARKVSEAIGMAGGRSLKDRLM